MVYFLVKSVVSYYFKVGAKDMMNYGDRIILPVQIEKSPSMQAKKAKVTSSEDEMKFLRSLIIYKVSSHG